MGTANPANLANLFLSSFAGFVGFAVPFMAEDRGVGTSVEVVVVGIVEGLSTESYGAASRHALPFFLGSAAPQDPGQDAPATDCGQFLKFG